MNAWLSLWTLLLVAGLSVFALLTIVVTIGGAKDVRELLRTLEKKRSRKREDSEEKPEGDEPFDVARARDRR